MPTKVALALYLDIERLVETVSGMSTKVDLTYKNKRVHVETVSEMSTEVAFIWSIFFISLKL